MSYGLEVDQIDEETVALRLSGRIDMESAGSVLADATKALEPKSFRRLVIDLSRVEYFDSAAAALVIQLKRLCQDCNASLDMGPMDRRIKGLLDLLHIEELSRPYTIRRPQEEGILQRIGGAVIDYMAGQRHLVTFVGETVITLITSVFKPSRIRLWDMTRTMERAGVEALPIVALISLLMGLIMGFQAAVQLRQFGANIFVADLVGLSIVRELGPLMTAIILAGRSGSAFAAEIGSMKISEEIDALVTMGINPVQFLVVPKILATVIVLPCLTLFADIIGIAGGLVVGVASLDLTVHSYMNETYKALATWDVISGLVKSVTFAVLVAGIGCLRGFQVEGGADSVGRMTTSAVVSGIFLIISADAIFTILFHYLS